MKKKILIVADKDLYTYKILDIVLDKSEFEVVECTTGRQAIKLCVSMKPDIMILELELPDMSSKDIIKAIREWSTIPFIIVSASQESDDIVHSLDNGANDYVMKPFDSDVLRARIYVCLRNHAIQETGVSEIRNGPLRIDLVRHQVYMGEKMIDFTPKEYKLLRYLIVHRGKMLSHRQILKEVWGPAHTEDIQYLRVFIGQIRDKIEANSSISNFIKTELGIGYRMELLEDEIFHKQGEMQV